MKALEVANFFIELDQLNGNYEMTNMRVNKLLYFAQGWSLALKGKPLFEDSIEAWEHGPVVNEIYQAFKPCGNNAIYDTVGDFDLESFSSDDVEFLSSVYYNYVRYSTSELRNITHIKGSPWDKTYQNGNGRNKQITNESIKTYFDSEKKIQTFDDFVRSIPYAD